MDVFHIRMDFISVLVLTALIFLFVPVGIPYFMEASIELIQVVGFAIVFALTGLLALGRVKNEWLIGMFCRLFIWIAVPVVAMLALIYSDVVVVRVALFLTLYIVSFYCFAATGVAKSLIKRFFLNWFFMMFFLSCTMIFGTFHPLGDNADRLLWAVSGLLTFFFWVECWGAALCQCGYSLKKVKTS